MDLYEKFNKMANDTTDPHADILLWHQTKNNKIRSGITKKIAELYKTHDQKTVSAVFKIFTNITPEEFVNMTLEKKRNTTKNKHCITCGATLTETETILHFNTCEFCNTQENETFDELLKKEAFDITEDDTCITIETTEQYDTDNDEFYFAAEYNKNTNEYIFSRVYEYQTININDWPKEYKKEVIELCDKIIKERNL